MPWTYANGTAENTTLGACLMIQKSPNTFWVRKVFVVGLVVVKISDRNGWPLDILLDVTWNFACWQEKFYGLWCWMKGKELCVINRENLRSKPIRSYNTYVVPFNWRGHRVLVRQRVIQQKGNGNRMTWRDLNRMPSLHLFIFMSFNDVSWERRCSVSESTDRCASISLAVWTRKPFYLLF